MNLLHFCLYFFSDPDWRLLLEKLLVIQLINILLFNYILILRIYIFILTPGVLGFWGQIQNKMDSSD